MEYCAGGDLYSRIQSGTLTNPDEINWYYLIFPDKIIIFLILELVISSNLFMVFNIYMELV